MRTTHQTLEDCKQRAVEDFKHLVIYYCVTRPQYNKTFKENGKFSLKLFLNWLKFLSTWDKRPASEKRQHANLYAKRSAEWNYKFGIDSNLIGNVLRFKVDGKTVKIPMSYVIDTLNKDKNNPLIKVINGGRKFVFENGKHKKDENGKSIVKCYWTNKYMIANEKYWTRLLMNTNYKDIVNFGSKRLQRIIFKWNETHTEQKPNEDAPKVVASPCNLTAQECCRMFSAGRMNEFALKILLSEAFNSKISDDGIRQLKEKHVEVTDDEYKAFAVGMHDAYYDKDRSDNAFNSIIWQMYEKYADIRELL